MAPDPGLWESSCSGDPVAKPPQACPHSLQPWGSVASGSRAAQPAPGPQPLGAAAPESREEEGGSEIPGTSVSPEAQPQVAGITAPSPPLTANEWRLLAGGLLSETPQGIT